MPRSRRLSSWAAGCAAAVLAGLVASGACTGDIDGTNPPGDGTPAAIAVVSGNDQTGVAGAVLAEPYVVLITDPDGDPVAGVEVAWSVLTGGGALAAPTSATDAQGQARMTHTLGADGGTNTARASVAGTTPLAAMFTATAPLADPVPAGIEIAGGNNQSAGTGQQLPDPLTVRIRNAAGIMLPAVSVTWAVTAGGGTLGSPTSATTVAGIASNTFTTGGSAGASTITATVTGNNALSASFTATATGITNGAVSVEDNLFDPDSVAVSAGGTVTWTWNGAAAHNVTWVSGGFANASTRSTGTHAVTFGSAGTYLYYCSIHGSPTSGMRGRVTVQ